MKKRINHILIALAGILTVSCNAWLDVTPDNAIADDDLFSTGFGYRNALNGIYTWRPTNSTVSNLVGDF